MAGAPSCIRNRREARDPMVLQAGRVTEPSKVKIRGSWGLLFPETLDGPSVYDQDQEPRIDKSRSNNLTGVELAVATPDEE